MGTEDFSIYPLTEKSSRRWLRVGVVVLAGIGVGCAFGYSGQISWATSIVLTVLMLWSFWSVYGVPYQVYLRTGDIASIRIGETTTSRLSEIAEIEESVKSLKVRLKDGSAVVFNLSPFPVTEVGHFLQALRLVLAVTQKEGEMILPRPNRVKIKTDRMVILPMSEKEQDAYLALKQEPGEAFYQLQDPLPESLAKAIYKEEVLNSGNRFFNWHLGLFEAEAMELIGYVALSGDSTIGLRSAQLGIGLRSDCRNRGFGSEAIEGVLNYLEAKTNLKKVTAGCFGENEACRKALVSGGMIQVASHSHYWFRHGDWVDGLEFEKVFQREAEDSETVYPIESDEENGADEIRLG